MQEHSHLSCILCATLMCSINVAVATLWLLCHVHASIALYGLCHLFGS